MTDQPDLYKLLQVDSEADPEVIQAAYRRLAQKFHPDLAAGPEAAERMVAINGAWEVLGDPDRRADYDRQREATRAAGEAQTQAAFQAGPRQPPEVPPRRGRRRIVPPPCIVRLAGLGCHRPEPVSSNWTSGAARTWAAATTSGRCAGPMAKARPARRPASRRAA